MSDHDFNLTVSRLTFDYKWTAKTSVYRCSCGKKKVVNDKAVATGKIKSCGCLHRDKCAALKKTHGKAGTRTYGIWKGMLSRCNRPTSSTYFHYGARGIRVCERWHDFVDFLADMGESPGAEYSIDRYPDKDGDYGPDNCRWATDVEQNQNSSQNVNYTFNGKTQCRAAWARVLGVSENALASRVERWGLEKALSTYGPAKTRISRGRPWSAARRKVFEETGK